MFNRFKKKKVTALLAAADGKVLPMSEATDEVFSSCSLGNGVVIYPTGEVIVAPADCRVTATMEGSNHAIGLTLDNGLDILLHIGVDTVKLAGKGFTALVQNGDFVKTGQPLIRFAREDMERAGYCMEIMEIIMENEAAPSIQYMTGITATAGETVIAEL